MCLLNLFIADFCTFCPLFSRIKYFRLFCWCFLAYWLMLSLKLINIHIGFYVSLNEISGLDTITEKWFITNKFIILTLMTEFFLSAKIAISDRCIWEKYEWFSIIKHLRDRVTVEHQVCCLPLIWFISFTWSNSWYLGW